LAFSWNVPCIGVDFDEGDGGIGGFAVHAKAGPLPAVEISIMVVVEDVEDDRRRGRVGFFAIHPQIGLIDGVAADAVVANRLA